MKVLASLGLLAMLAAPARAGGGVIRVQPIKGGGAPVVLPRTGPGGSSFKLGGKTYADWAFSSLPVTPGLRMGFRPQPSLETPASEAGAAAFHAEAMVETLAAPDLHLAPAGELILDPGPGTPPASARSQAFAGKSAALNAELQKAGPIARVNGETAASLGRRVLDLMTGGASIGSAASGLKPAAGLAGGLVGAQASPWAASNQTAAPGAQTLAPGSSLAVYARAVGERSTPPVPGGLETLEGASLDAPQGWTAALRTIPSRVTLIAMRAFDLGLAFTPKLAKKTHAAPAARTDAPAPWTAATVQAVETPLVLASAEGAALRDAIASDAIEAKTILYAPVAESETFAFFQNAGARSLARGSAWRPDYRGAQARRLEPMAPDPAAGLFLASLLPLVGLALVVGYRLN